MKGQPIWTGVVFVLIALAIGGYLWLAPKPSPKPTGPPEKITIGVETSLLTTPVWIAENKGYFQEEGLDLTIQEFDSGKAALAAMLYDENDVQDITTVAQTPIVFNSFKRKDFALFAAMVNSDNDVKILVNQDKGIKAPLDLRGKKVGVTKGSTGHFYLGLFLTHIHLNLSDVEVVDINASGLPQALAEGRVDAISVWEPHILNARKLLGEKALVLPKEDIFREDFYFVAKKDFVNERPEVLEKFLRAVERGEEFIQKNEEEAINIVSQRLKMDKKLVASIWHDFVFQLILDQSILVVLEDEANWAIRNKLTDKADVPNYLEFIYKDALKAVKPEAVTIIH